MLLLAGGILAPFQIVLRFNMAGVAGLEVVSGFAVGLMVGRVYDGNFIDAIGFRQSDLNLLKPGAGHVLADIVRPYRHLAMAPVNKDGQLD